MREIPVELQKLFVRLLLLNQQSAEVNALTNSFGWKSNEVSILVRVMSGIFKKMSVLVKDKKHFGGLCIPQYIFCVINSSYHGFVIFVIN